MPKTEKEKDEYVNWFLSQAEEDYRYTEDELKLIRAVKTSNIDPHEKMTFGLLLMNYGTEKLRVNNLQERLALSYQSKGLEKYLDEIVLFNPKLGYVSIEAGESRRDEKDDYSCYLSIPVPYDKDTDKYFETARKIEEKIKQVLRIVLVDAKKMRI